MHPRLTSRLPDLLAGVSIAGLLLPEAVAYSGVANLPPQAGVIAMFVGLVCYGLIGRSRYAVVTATSSSAAGLRARRADRPVRVRARAADSRRVARDRREHRGVVVVAHAGRRVDRRD